MKDDAGTVKLRLDETKWINLSDVLPDMTVNAIKV
jgi:hypothetical protein